MGKLGSFGGNITKRSKPSSGQFEKKWVDDIVKSGGVGCKIVNLSKYVGQFENLSKNHVLEHLDDKLENGTWQKQGKALVLIVALMEGKSSEVVIDYFTQSPENIQNLQNAKKRVLRSKANAIMEYVEVDEDEEEEEDNSEEEEEEEEEDVSISVPKGDDLLNMGGGNNAKEESEDDMFGGMDVGQVKKTNTGNVDLLNMNEALPPSKPAVQSRNSDDIMDLMGDITGSGINTSVPQNNGNADNGSSAFGFDLGGGGDSTSNTQQNGMSETTVVEDQKRKKSEYAYLDVLANDANVSQQNTTTSNDILNMMSNPTAQANNSQAQTVENSGSAFGFDLGGNANSNANVQPSVAQTANGGGGSAFGFDLGGNGGASNLSTNQSNSSSMNSSVIMNKNSGSPLLQSMGTGNPNMMTPQMMQQNNQMGTMLNNQMGAMNQMQAMMQQMQAMNMNPMQMQMMMQQMQQNTMTNNQQQQQQPPQQQYGMSRNDPFANIGRSNQSQPAVPKTKGPDPFAQFGLNSMK